MLFSSIMKAVATNAKLFRVIFPRFRDREKSFRIFSRAPATTVEGSQIKLIQVSIFSPFLLGLKEEKKPGNANQCINIPEIEASEEIIRCKDRA